VPTMSSKPAQASVPRDDGNPSVALYLSGLVITLIGMAAVNSAIGDTNFASITPFLAIFGFVFSYVVRLTRLNRRWLYWAAALCVLVGGYCQFSGVFNLMSIVPPGIQQGDMVLALILECVSIVRAWTLLSDASVVLCIVLSVSMMGLVGYYDVNTDRLIFFMVFVVTSIFMVAHQHFLIHQSLTGRTVKQSGRLVATQGGIALITTLLVVVLSAVLVIPLQAVGSNLSLSAALRSLINAGHASSSPETGQGVLFSDDPSFPIGLGNGQGFSNDDTVLMQIRPTDRRPQYWRGRSYDRYVSTGWESSMGGPQSGATLIPTRDGNRNVFPIPLSGIGDNSIGPPILPHKGDIAHAATERCHFTIRAGHTHMIYYPAYPVSFSTMADDNISPKAGPDGEVDVGNQGEGFSYTVDSLAVTPKVADLRKDSLRNLDETVKRYYVNERAQDILSTSDQARLLMTANQIVLNLPLSMRNEYDEAEAIRRWVSGRCTYSLTVPPIPQDNDAVSYFLFTTRRGYCDLFASSMTLLCRYARIPARVVTGFATGEFVNGEYQVKAADKHAWVEVYFPGYGWYPFDPTADAATDADNPGGPTDPRQLLHVVVTWLIVLFGTLDVPTIAVVLVIVGLITYLTKVEVIDRINRTLRRRRAAKLAGLPSLRNSHMPPERARKWHEIDRIVVRLTRLLTSADCVISAGATPREYVAQVVRQGMPDDERFSDRTYHGNPARQALEAAVGRIMDSYEVLTFGTPEAAEHVDIAEDRRALRVVEELARESVNRPFKWLLRWRTRSPRGQGV